MSHRTRFDSELKALLRAGADPKGGEVKALAARFATRRIANPAPRPRLIDARRLVEAQLAARAPLTARGAVAMIGKGAGAILLGSLYLALLPAFKLWRAWRERKQAAPAVMA